MTDIKKKWNFQIAPVSGNYRIMSARPKDTQLITTGFNTLSKCRYGWMLYHSADQYVGGALRKYGEFSEGEVTIFRQLLRSGDVVVEAGANFGAHTVAMAQMIGPTGYIFAFEPQRLVFQAMVANIAINSLDNVTTVQAALGSHAGVARIPILNPNKGLNFGSFSIGMFDIGESVPIQTIDSLDLNQCRLIKVDVEGMEYEVLEGARKTIERLRPLLYVENDRGEKSQQLISQIQSFGYRLWWHLPDLFNPNNLHQDSENIYKDLISVNMLCAPQNSEFAFDLPEILTSSDDWRKTCSNI